MVILSDNSYPCISEHLMVLLMEILMDILLGDQMVCGMVCMMEIQLVKW
jgi:hypothetical protein